MKTLKYILISAVAVASISCQKDVMKDIKSGEWNHERSIVEIAFENQIGISKITRDADANGMVEFTFNTMVADLSQAKVKSVAVSYGAKIDIKAGDVLDFDNAANTVFATVTSQNGDKLDWQIKANPFSEELLGTWQITSLDQYGGVGAEYGGAGAGKMTLDTKLWPDNEGADKELDNTLTFTLGGVADDGNAFGTVVNDAGPDATYANFIFYQDKTNNPNDTYDVNKLYRKIAKGTGKWKRNNQAGTIVFLDAADNITGESIFVGAGTENLLSNSDGSKPLSVTVAEKAFTFKLSGTGSWDFIYAGKDRFVFNPSKYWIQISKVQ